MRRLMILLGVLVVSSGLAVTILAQRDGFVGPGRYEIEIAATGKVLDLRREDMRTVQQWELKGSEGPVAQIASMTGTDVATYTRDRPGVSAFAMRDGEIYHTYSSYARGLDGLWGMYQWLDRAPLGRNEEGVWWRHHDRYGV